MFSKILLAVFAVCLGLVSAADETRDKKDISSYSGLNGVGLTAPPFGAYDGYNGLAYNQFGVPGYSPWAQPGYLGNPFYPQDPYYGNPALYPGSNIYGGFPGSTYPSTYGARPF